MQAILDSSVTAITAVAVVLFLLGYVMGWCNGADFHDEITRQSRGDDQMHIERLETVLLDRKETTDDQ